MFTPRQQKHYRPLVDKAWAVVCRRGGVVDTPAGRDHWYRQEIKSVLGIDSTAKADPVLDFDRVMLHFATLAQDDYWIRRCAAGEETRALHQLQRTVDNAARDGVEISDVYVAGIQRNMGFGDRGLKELPAATILKINTACFLHWKRHRHQAVGNAER
jgi:hypothetical protein